jgi:hypothetical protein
MEGIDNHKIVEELLVMFPKRNLTDVNFIRELNKEIALRVDPFRENFTEKYVDHKANLIFRKIIHLE